MASNRPSLQRPASSNSFQIADQNEAENFSGSQSPFRLSYTVLQEKRARKAAEEDAVRLCNRVKQLQKESERASKRVNDTKKKIFDVRSQQQRLVDLKVNLKGTRSAYIDLGSSQKFNTWSIPPAFVSK